MSKWVVCRKGSGRLCKDNIKERSIINCMDEMQFDGMFYNPRLEARPFRSGIFLWGNEMIIYMATNTLNNKKYIGQTVQTLWKRRIGHETKARNGSGTYFHNAIRKHGAENFTWEVICTANDIGALNILEEYFIAKYGTLDGEKGYNLRTGGDNGRTAESTKKKLSAIRKGVKNPHSEITKKKLSIALAGKPKAVEHRKKLSIANTGKTLSPEQKDKIGIAVAGNKNPAFNPRVLAFYHSEYGIVSCPAFDFRKKYSLDRRCLSDLVLGKQKSHRGWRMAANDE